MKTYSFSAKLPLVLLGVPLSESENPFLAIPTKTVKTLIVIYNCSDKTVDIQVGTSDINHLISGFVEGLDELAEGLCIKVLPTDGINNASKISIYSLITSLIIHAIAKYHGEILDTWEILEIARYADPISRPSGWAYVLDAARYAVLTGTPVVFRNEEEYAKIESKVEANLRYQYSIRPTSQKLTRESLGGDVYNALVRLAGVMVLEAAVKLRERKDLFFIIETLNKLQNGIISSVWSIDYPPSNCTIVPGMPTEFDVYCW